MFRELGRSGVKVSAMGIGLWAIGGPWDMNGGPAGWGEVDDEESIRAIHAAMDHGINFFDTAANYGAGHSETVLARALVGKRDQAVIATKFGYRVYEGERKVGNYDGVDAEHSDVAAHLRADCEASLRRLGTDIIDLYQFHVNWYDVDKAAEVKDVLESLVSEGKIRFYGWSTDNPAAARSWADGAHYTAVQASINVIQDSPEIIAVCDELNLATIIRGPLGMGLLTGKYDKSAKWAANDVRTASWFQDHWFENILDNLEAIREILTSDGRTLAQGALAWLWARSPHTLPIPGVRTVAQVEENAGAMKFGALRADQMAQIEALLGRAESAAAD